MFTDTSNGGCRREEKSPKHMPLFAMLFFQSLLYLSFVWSIQEQFMYWLHWKSEKNRTEPNEQDALKYSKSLNQMTSYAHWHAFLYLHAKIKTYIHISYLISEKNSKLNELEHSKTPTQMSSFAHKHVFLKQTNIHTLLYWFYTKS